jgi:hypothetical protein
MVLFSQQLLCAIGSVIAAREPETGGALLRLRSTNLLVELVPDPEAATSAATYVPSARLTDAVRAREREAELQFAGIIHSHPGRMSQPSQQDHRAFARSLALNAHLAGFMAPIVTVQPPGGDLAENEIALQPRGKLTLHVAYRGVRRSPEDGGRHGANGFYRMILGADRMPIYRGHGEDPRNDPITMAQVPAAVHPADDDFDALVAALTAVGLAAEVKPTDYRALNGAPFIVHAVNAGGAEIVMMFPLGYPFVPPLCLLTISGATEEVSAPWTVTRETERLGPLARMLIARIGGVPRPRAATAAANGPAVAAAPAAPSPESAEPAVAASSATAAATGGMASRAGTASGPSAAADRAHQNSHDFEETDHVQWS